MRTNEFLKQCPPESHSWTGKLTLGLGYPSEGWIQFTITCTAYMQGVIVNCSNVFDPFPGFIHWLEAIAAGRLPAECHIDEEGVGKLFRAMPVNADEFLLEILIWPWYKDDSEERPIFLYAQVNRRQLLSEFLKRWDDFLANQYDPEQWSGMDLRSLDVSKLREQIAV